MGFQSSLEAVAKAFIAFIIACAAIGRPDRKVREKGPDGNETEDWIYGNPPAKTIFVSFEGDKVTQVHQYPQ